MSKGSQIAISGRITTRSYDAKDGTKRYVTEVVADTFNGVFFLSKGNGGSNTVVHSTVAVLIIHILQMMYLAEWALIMT